MTCQSAPSVHLREQGWRLAQLCEALAAAEVDVGILVDPATVCYFTGNQISGPNIAIVTTDGGLVVICDEYDAYNFECLERSMEIIAVSYSQDPVACAANWLLQNKPKATLGLEFADLRHSAFQTFSEELSEYNLSPIDALIGNIRLRKSEGELESIRGAAAAVETAFCAARDVLDTPVSERRLAALIYDALLANGSDYVAGQPYVKSGERALNTHARWSGRKIDAEEHVLLEIGGCVDRYHAALMRTRLPTRLSPQLQRAADAVRKGRDAHLEVLRPGITGQHLHSAYLEALEKCNVRSWNRHSSGYSLGIAFPPYWGEIKLMTLAPGIEREIVPGMVLHVISGLTEPAQEVGHVGLSECVLVTENGWERLIELEDFL